MHGETIHGWSFHFKNIIELHDLQRATYEGTPGSNVYLHIGGVSGLNSIELHNTEYRAT